MSNDRLGYFSNWCKAIDEKIIIYIEVFHLDPRKIFGARRFGDIMGFFK